MIMEVMMETQRKINHIDTLGYNFGPAPKARKVMTDIAVILLDRNGEILAGKELAFGNQAVVAVPIVGNEDASLHTNLVEEPLTSGVVTATKNPGNRLAAKRVKRSPKPEFAGLFL
jgi:hypothetical protein